MKNYKYKIVSKDNLNLKELTDWLNSFGEKGWRVISLTKKEKSIFLILEKETQSKNEVKNPELNDVIKLFDFNPSYRLIYSNKSQRKALEILIKEKGRDKVIEMIGWAKKANGDSKNKAPTITTPITLANKWIQLENYNKRINKSMGSRCKKCGKELVENCWSDYCWECNKLI